MPRLMYDSTNPFVIPLNAPMVAGYVDGHTAWMPEGWALFPNAVKVKISVGVSPQDAQVADVENTDYTPWESVDFVLLQRSKGIDPSVYVSLDLWPATRTEFQLRGVPEPHWWIAWWNGIYELLPGAVAKQYVNPPGSGGSFDLSCVADFWPGVDGAYGPGGGNLPGGMSWLDEEISPGLTVRQHFSFMQNDVIGGTEDNPEGISAEIHELEAAVAKLVAAIAPGGGLTAAQAQQISDIQTQVNAIATKVGKDLA